jgi:hypothetical protein
MEHFDGNARVLLVHVVDGTQQIMKIRRWEYNENRPHRALGEKIPNQCANEIATGRDFIGFQTAENTR